MHPQVQSNVWKSVVRVVISVSDSVFTTATALVVARTSTHLYLRTNLGLYVDPRFAGFLSADFKKELADFLIAHPWSVKGPKRVEITENEKPQVAIERLTPEQGDTMMEEVAKFTLEADVCWKSSADLDFAIFKVAVPEHVQLIACTIASFDVVPTMNVNIFLFRNTPYVFGAPYAIIPAHVTSHHVTGMCLSAPGIPEGAVVFTDHGIAVGYTGGCRASYPSCGFKLRGLLTDLLFTLAQTNQDNDS
ncbi:unnamed protein product [Phytophthora lilii]|uniref:Unnamed protein product n=1 Tax=Phytophthora lilii TaxID=2077276 RepID=A0A9W7D8F8_9STRA|nr:unnamed protein product [Phytophthora lilii]